MKYLAVISLFCVAITLGVVCNSNKIEKRYKTILLAYLVSVMLWIGFMTVSRLLTPTEILIQMSSWWFYLGLIPFLAAVSAFYFQYFFALSYGEKKFKWGWFAKFNLVLFMVFFIVAAIPGLVLESFLIPEGRTYGETHKGPFILGYLIYVLYFYVSTVVVLIKRIRTTQNLVLKAQLKCLLFGAGVFLGLAIFTNLILSSVFNYPELNSLGPAFYMIEAAVYVYAVSRYRFLNLEHLWPFSNSTVVQINRAQKQFQYSLKKATRRLKQILNLRDVELVFAGDARYGDLRELVQYAEDSGGDIVRTELDYQIKQAEQVPPKLKKIRDKMDRLMIVALLPIRNESEIIGVLLLEQKEDRLFSVQEMTSLKRVLAKSTYLIAREKDYKKTLSQLVAGNNETQKELFKDLMHEVRTPLMLARNMPELIDWGQLKPEDQAYLRQSQESLQDLSGKLERISEAFQWSQGAIPLQKTRATLGELREFVCQDMKNLDSDWSKKVEFAWRDERLSDALFFFDMPALKQAFVELGKNALFYHGDSPVKIQVEVYQEEDEIVVEYADNGMGIESKNWERIFDLMFVVAESRNEKESGLGLGLTIARGIVEAHEGTLNITKSVPGEGTTFEVRLPLKRAN